MRFDSGTTPLLDEGWDDIAQPLDVVEYLAQHDTIGGRCLGEVSDAVRFMHPLVPGLELSASWGDWRNYQPWRASRSARDPYYDDRGKPKSTWSSPVIELVWFTPRIELAKGLQYLGDDQYGRPRIWARRWDTAPRLRGPIARCGPHEALGVADNR